MNFIILDLEFNQFFEFPNTKVTVSAQCPAEIIQIGAVKLDNQLNFAGSINFYVRPQIYTKMHPHIEKITGITTDKLRSQPRFYEVFDEFAEFTGGGSSVFCIWGPDDIKELYKNILYHKLNGSRITKNYINVQKLAGSYLQNNNNAIGLKNAVEALKLPVERPFHDAFSDALYTVDIFKIIAGMIAEKEGASKHIIDVMTVQKIDISRLKQTIAARLNEVNLQSLYSYAQTKLRRKLNERDKEAVLSIYNAGRTKQFDI